MSGSTTLSASLGRLLPVVALTFLQACSEHPETIVIDKTQETHHLAAQKAATFNRSAEKALLDLKQASLDGKGHVYFNGGVGIVYPQALELERSSVIKQSFCTAYNPETLLKKEKCATREIESLATLPKIYSPTEPLYINGVKSVVCPGKPSALFSLTDLFDQNRDKSPCKDLSPSALPTPALYRYVTQGIGSSKGLKI